MTANTSTEEALYTVQNELQSLLPKLDEYHQLVYEDRDTLLYADESGHELNEALNAAGLDRDVRAEVLTAMHDLASEKTDYEWSASDPLVVPKPNQFQAGEAHVLREIARRTTTEGSVARAVDQLVTEAYGWSKKEWADETGRNPSTVTRMTTPKDE